MESEQHKELRRATRIFGIETEYAFAVLGSNSRRLDPERSVDMLMRKVRDLVPHLNCGYDKDVFTANGSRVYLDVGLHPEVATPECSTPEEAVLFSRAGDNLLARAAQAMESEWNEKAEAVLWKANVDYRTGSTWASHESYLHYAPQSHFSEQLISHLVTRIIYTGAGGFDNTASSLRFVVSPRVRHLKHEFSNCSTRDRAIFNTRDEPLAASPNRRLHVLAGESLWSEVADYLRIGTTALLIAQIDAGRRPQSGLDLTSPLDALALITGDVGCTAKLGLRPSGCLTAIGIQRRLLEGVENDLGAPYMPPWATAVCERWRAVLDGLEASPSSLVGVLDWPTKLAVLKRQCVSEGIKWTFSGEKGPEFRLDAPPSDCRTDKSVAETHLLETDLHFNRLDGRGIFSALDREGSLNHRIVSPDAVERALYAPPSVGRARIRAACVERFAHKGSDISCNWDHIVDHERGIMLHLDDPLLSESNEWIPMPSAEEPAFEDLDPVIEPIARAVASGAPRRALNHIHLLISATGQLSLAVCRYCASVISSIVPTDPVPVLGRGSSTVGPVLTSLFERVKEFGNYSVEDQVGILLYRFHEACGRYQLSRHVIRQLLARSQEIGNLRTNARLTNNLGYEYLLEGRWASAQPLFERSVALFEDVGDRSEVLNVSANLLECRLGHTAIERWNPHMPTLREINRAMMENGDWRARKTLRLLARSAEYHGRYRAARGWMRRALAVSDGIPTQLRDWDKIYLYTLETRESL